MNGKLRAPAPAGSIRSRALVSVRRLVPVTLAGLVFALVWLNGADAILR